MNGIAVNFEYCNLMDNHVQQCIQGAVEFYLDLEYIRTNVDCI